MGDQLARALRVAPYRMYRSLWNYQHIHLFQAVIRYTWYKKVRTTCGVRLTSGFLVGSPLMRLAETPHGVSRWVHAMSAGSVKTRRGLSRQCRAARVYGVTDYGYA